MTPYVEINNINKTGNICRWNLRQRTCEESSDLLECFNFQLIHVCVWGVKVRCSLGLI